MKKYFYLQDDTSKTNSAANELGLANVGGVFVVLMGGMGVACVVAVFEFVWKSRKIAVEERVSEGVWGKNLKRNFCRFICKISSFVSDH